jgi:hypothetical protein
VLPLLHYTKEIGPINVPMHHSIGETGLVNTKDESRK